MGTDEMGKDTQMNDQIINPADSEKPAIAGGEKEFAEFLPIVRATLPSLEEIKEPLQEILASGMVTNFSKYVRQFEAESAAYLGVKNSLTVSNGTSGLLLAAKCLGLKGEVIVPSFTFSATAHALVWNGLTPVFADINPETFNLDPRKVEEKITERTSAILATHVFGNPCDIEALEAIARRHNLKLFFDAAHALGSQYKGKKIGSFGDAEIFSTSGTKLLVTGEGGLVTTNNQELAEKLKIGRNYGDPGNYNCQFVGYNGKMPEFSAIVGLASLKKIELAIGHRNHLRQVFEENLKGIPGLSFQKIHPENVSTIKDFAIVVDPARFGLNRDVLAKCLAAENIHTKKYFYPPIHQMKAYLDLPGINPERLEHTEHLARNVLCLPIYNSMSEETVRKICHAIRKIHLYREEALASCDRIKKVIITGGAGYLGCVLTKKLLDKGYKVKVLDQLIFGKEPLKELMTHPHFELEIGVTEDRYMVGKCMEGVDAVIHLSGLSNDPSCEINPDLTRKSNVDATLILLEEAKKRGVKKFIFASSCSVYGFTGGVTVTEESRLNPLTAYAKSKVDCEKVILASANEDFTTVSLRKATIYGPSPRMRFDLVINTMTGTALSEGKIVINGGKQWRPFLHVEDAAEAYIFMLETDREKINGQVFNVGSNEQNLRIIDLAEKVAKVVTQAKVELSDSPDERSYRVGFDKINGLGWRAKRTIEEGIAGVKEMFEDGTVSNFRDLKYFNIRRMITYLNL